MISLSLTVLYYPILLYYLPHLSKRVVIGPYVLFPDVFHYSLYEEMTYRSFLLTHFVKKGILYLEREHLHKHFSSVSIPVNT